MGTSGVGLKCASCGPSPTKAAMRTAREDRLESADSSGPSYSMCKIPGGKSKSRFFF